MRFWVGNDSANEERSIKDTVVRGVTLRAPVCHGTVLIGTQVRRRTQDDSPTHVPIFKREPGLRAEGSLSQ